MTDTTNGPAAVGVRVPYDDLPASLHAWVEDQLGAPVVRATTQPFGFSPGVAARLECADGSRAFIKAVSADVNPDTPRLHRHEAEVLPLLPATLPVPRLRAAYDEHPWVALLIEDVDGRHPQLPWRTDELDLLLAALRQVAAVTDVDLPPLAPEIDAWAGFRSLASGAPPPGLDPWVAAHLDRLAELEATAAAAMDGRCLQHSDTRADNTLVAGGRAWIVDWPWAGLAAPWFDVVVAAPSIAMQGGPLPDDLLARSRVVAASDHEAVRALVAAVAGIFVRQSLLPAPPGLPTLREFQAAQGHVAVEWLRGLTGWR